MAITTGGLSSQDWLGLIMASNEAAMQWYAMTTQKPLPTSGNVLTVGPAGVQVGASGGLLVIGLAVVALLLLSK